VEPLVANVYTEKTQEGSRVRVNPYLQKYLEEKFPSEEVDKKLQEVIAAGGSVQNVEWMDSETKKIFKTASEIDQYILIKYAAERAKYITQSQSINLFFDPFDEFDDDWEQKSQDLIKMHIDAWRLGLPSLYYLRSRSIQRPVNAAKVGYEEECQSCQ